jgi:lipid II:glycine glycyltransferase (peptidoglycan interpeptide bridge formation enzyme)
MHLVRWRAIRDAVAEAMPAIELGGVDLPGRRSIPDPGDPNHGLYMHKAGFGARWVVRTPARRIVLRPWADRAARGARRLVGRASRLRCKA